MRCTTDELVETLRRVQLDAGVVVVSAVLAGAEEWGAAAAAAAVVFVCAVKSRSCSYKLRMCGGA